MHGDHKNAMLLLMDSLLKTFENKNQKLTQQIKTTKRRQPKNTFLLKSKDKWSMEQKLSVILSVRLKLMR